MQTGKTYRAKPSPAEQARRKQWGRTWGKLISDAARKAREQEG